MLRLAITRPDTPSGHPLCSIGLRGWITSLFYKDWATEDDDVALKHEEKDAVDSARKAAANDSPGTAVGSASKAAAADSPCTELTEGVDFCREK